MQKNILKNGLKQHKFKMIFSCLFATISSIIMLVPFLTVYKILEISFENSKDYTIMYTYGIIAISSLIIAMIVMFASIILSHIAAFKIIYQIRIDALRHLGEVSLGFHSEKSTGEIKKVLEVDIEKIELLIAHKIPDLISTLSLVIGTIIVMFFINYILALASMIPIILAFLLQFKILRNPKTIETTKKFYDQLEIMNANAIEYIAAMPVVKIFNLTVFAFKKFEKSILDNKKLVVAWTMSFKKGYILFSIIISSAAIFILPIILFIINSNPSNLKLILNSILFLILLPGVSVQLFKLISLGSHLSSVNESIMRIKKIFDVEKMTNSKESIIPSNFDIEFKNVSFKYDRNDVLENISFKIKQNTITALVGPSGSGKSTIAMLTSKFYNANNGDITIGNISVNNIKNEDFMKYVSFCFQDSYLFYDTIYENIKMGSNANKEEIINATKSAMCHDFIMELEKGYQTKIGEGGIYLSGGEKQRIAIARAILKDAPILILDEATAFADFETEYYIQQAINKLIKNKTVLVIAHRLNSIKNVDQIILLNKGKIEDVGTHNNLLAKSSLYNKLWENANKSLNWKVIKK